MGDFIYQCVNYALEFLKFALIYRMAFEFEFRKKWYVLAGDIVLVLVAGVYYGCFPENEILSMTIYVLLVIQFFLMTFQKTGEWYRRLAVGVWAFSAILLLDGIFYMTVLMWQFENSRVTDILADFLTISALYIIFRVARQKNPCALTRISPGYYIAFTIVGVTNATVLAIQSEYADENVRTRWMFIIIAAGVILQMLMVLILAISRNLWKEKENLNRYYLSIQEEHYRYLESREEKTKRFRHDIRNHLYMMEKLIQEGKKNEVQDYIRSAFDTVDSSHNYISIGNPIVDAIINQYISMCEKRNIQFEVKGHMPIVCELPAFDLCTIFSNLLQNAVEAAENCEDKSIFMQFRYDERNIYIREENTYKSLCYENGKLISTKGENHGYGTRNIKQSIEKYGGMIAYEISEEHFTALLEIPQTIHVKK